MHVRQREREKERGGDRGSSVSCVILVISNILFMETGLPQCSLKIKKDEKRKIKKKLSA